MTATTLRTIQRGQEPGHQLTFLLLVLSVISADNGGRTIGPSKDERIEQRSRPSRNFARESAPLGVSVYQEKRNIMP